MVYFWGVLEHGALEHGAVGSILGGTRFQRHFVATDPERARMICASPIPLIQIEKSFYDILYSFLQYMRVIRASLRKFRQDLDEMLNNLRNSNARFRSMLK